MYTSQLFVPRKELTPYVSSIFIMESDEPINFSIMPQACTTLTFCYSGCLYITDKGVEHAIPNANITGGYDSYKQCRIAANTGIIILKFTDSGASGFFDFPVEALFNASHPLNIVIPDRELEQLETLLSGLSAPEQKIAVLEEFLLRKIVRQPADELILAAMENIKQANGNLKIKDICRKLYISESQFDRRFRKSVGIGAKKYSSLVRITRIISEDRTDRKLTEKAYDAGYFDQAHFIRDFKTYTGYTPYQYFKLRVAPSLPLCPCASLKLGQEMLIGA